MNYLNSNLDWDYYLKHIKFLEAAKRDEFPKETIESWFIEMMRRCWTRKTFDTQFSAVMSATKYGKISFDIWVKSKVMYTEAEINAQANRLLNERLAKAEKAIRNGWQLTAKDEKIIELYAKEHTAKIIYEKKQAEYERRLNELIEIMPEFEEIQSCITNISGNQTQQ